MQARHPSRARGLRCFEMQRVPRDAIAPGRLDLGDRILEREIRDAFAQGRVRMRQIEVNYSPAPTGQGTMRFQNVP